MYRGLTGKIVLVTGASSGIGEACCRQFAASGSHLIMAARRVEKLEKIAQELIEKYGIRIHTCQMDVRSYEQVEKSLGNLPKEFQEIDILVNNAGLALDTKETQDTTLEDLDSMIDTNVKGLMYVIKVVLPGMKLRNRGHIINISSIAGHEAYKGGSIYCASKFGVEAITKALRKELVATPLRVTAVSPGLCETEFSIVRFKGEKEKASNVYRTLTTEPLTGEDVADSILYVASRPSHVQINDIILTPTCQASAESVSRKTS